MVIAKMGRIYSFLLKNIQENYSTIWAKQRNMQSFVCVETKIEKFKIGRNKTKCQITAALDRIYSGAQILTPRLSSFASSLSYEYIHCRMAKV